MSGQKISQISARQGILFIGAGIVILIVSFFVYRHTVSWLERSKQIEATVVDIKEERSRKKGKSKRMYRSVYRFTLPEGEEITVNSKSSSSSSSDLIGDRVMLRYDSE